VSEPVPCLNQRGLGGAPEDEIGHTRRAGVPFGVHVPTAVGRDPRDKLLMPKMDHIAWLAGRGRPLQVRAEVRADGIPCPFPHAKRDLRGVTALQQAPARLRHAGNAGRGRLRHLKPEPPVLERSPEERRQDVCAVIGLDLAVRAALIRVPMRWHIGTSVVKRAYRAITAVLSVRNPMRTPISALMSTSSDGWGHNAGPTVDVAAA